MVESGASPEGTGQRAFARRGTTATPKGPEDDVAKVNPSEFFRQVRAETAKVVWPTRKETVSTAMMVVIMTALLGIFFFGVDSAFSALVRALLRLVG